MDVITYARCDYNQTVLVKWIPVIQSHMTRYQAQNEWNVDLTKIP